MPYIDILFFIAFLGQIFLISYYFPRKMLSRERFVIDNYPPSSYPKLYPKPIEEYEKDLRRTGQLFNFILGIGLLLWVVMLRFVPANVWDECAGFYFILQFLPMIYLELSAFETYKLMRIKNERSTRSAELRPRHLFDFVSPILVGAAVFIYVALMLFILFMSQNELYVGNAANTKMISITVSNLLLAGIIYINIYGKKLNPHRSNKDRLNQIEIVVKQVVLISIAGTGYIGFDTVVDYLSLSELIPIFQCLFLQLLAVISLWGLRSGNISDIDFDVYKKEALEVKA